MDRPHHQRLSTPHVASGEHALAAGLVVGRLHIAAGVEFKAEVFDWAFLIGAGEAHREQRQLAGPLFFAPRHFTKLLTAALSVGVPLDPHGLGRLQVTVFVPHKLLGEDAPLAATALLVGRTGPQHHRPVGPGGVFGPLAAAGILAEIWRLGQEFKLRQALGPLPVARAVAVAAGVTAADHNHVFPGGCDLAGDIIASVLLVLLRQEVHREMHTLQVAAWDRQVASQGGSAAEQDGVVIVDEFLGRHIATHIGTAAELNPLFLHLPHPPPDLGLLQLEVWNAIHQQPTRTVRSLKHRHLMTSAVELLSSRHPGRATSDHSHPLARPHCRRLRNRPPFFEGAVCDRHFDLLDGHRILVDPQHTRRLAGSRAHTSRKLRKVVGRVQTHARFVPLLAIHEIVEVRNDVAKRATGVAEGNATVHTASPLLLDLLFREDREELVVVLQPLLDWCVAGNLPLILHEAAWLAHLFSPE